MPREPKTTGSSNRKLCKKQARLYSICCFMSLDYRTCSGLCVQSEIVVLLCCHSGTKQATYHSDEHSERRGLLCAGVEDAEAVRQTVEPEAAATAAVQPARAAPNRPAPAGSVKMLDMFLRKVFPLDYCNMQQHYWQPYFAYYTSVCCCDCSQMLHKHLKQSLFGMHSVTVGYTRYTVWQQPKCPKTGQYHAETKRHAG